jgi:hypothetical protein
MSFERLNEATLFYRQRFLLALNSNDVLRTLEISVESDLQNISFMLKTDFIKELLFSLFFLLINCFGAFTFPPITILIFIITPLLTGFIIKKTKLWRIKKDIITYFKNLKTEH